MRETRGLLEQALRDSLDAGTAATLLVPAVHEFVAASLALTPDLAPDALVHRVFRLILHVARTAPRSGAGNTHPALERLIAIGKVCADALRGAGVHGTRPDVVRAPRAPTDLARPRAANTRAAAQNARARARALVSDAMRARMRSAALVAAADAGLRASEGLQAEFRHSISRYVRTLRQLGEPAESVITDVRVLTLECASDLCAPGPEPACAWVEPLHDELVQLAIDAYCDAPAA
ncbi:MAG TPA: hypothetical protein VHB25_21605 [Gemmatimonadaceae bacterium]|nr:hypothetical protein [Gemmatimonadaceae bacterium]